MLDVTETVLFAYSLRFNDRSRSDVRSVGDMVFLFKCLLRMSHEYVLGTLRKSPIQIILPQSYKLAPLIDFVPKNQNQKNNITFVKFETDSIHM